MNTIENKTFLYIEIAQKIERKINDEVLKAGDKLPVIRVLKQEHGVSIGTILQAYYYYLEAKSLIEPRPRSGYYVVFSTERIHEAPVKTNPNQSTVL